MRASFCASTSATVVVPRSPRLRFVDLLLRMCCLNACPRRNFPFFVRLKRFAAPRWVFSLIFFAFFAIVFLLRLFYRGDRRAISFSSQRSLRAPRFFLGRRCLLCRRRRSSFGLAPAALRPPRED